MSSLSKVSKAMPKRLGSDFLNTMRNVQKSNDVEKAIESAVNVLLEGYFQFAFGKRFEITRSYPLNTDGLIEARIKSADLGFDGSENALYGDYFSVLVEAKREMSLSGSKGLVHRSQVLVQVVHYLKNFEKKGFNLPKVVVIADEDEIFMVGNCCRY